MHQGQQWWWLGGLAQDDLARLLMMSSPGMRSILEQTFSMSSMFRSVRSVGRKYESVSFSTVFA